MSPPLTRRDAVAALALACSGCLANEEKNMTMKPPLKPNQVLDPDSLYAKAWPGQPGLFKISDKLILQIPPQFHKFWEQRDWLGRSLVPRAPTPIDKLKPIELVGFQMFLPDFGGFTPDNYEKTFPTDRIDVTYISSAPMSLTAPGAVGSYPPNVIKRLTSGANPSINPEKFVDKYGLKCYEQKLSANGPTHLLWPKNVGTRRTHFFKSGPAASK